MKSASRGNLHFWAEVSEAVDLGLKEFVARFMSPRNMERVMRDVKLQSVEEEYAIRKRNTKSYLA